MNVTTASSERVRAVLERSLLLLALVVLGVTGYVQTEGARWIKTDPEPSEAVMVLGASLMPNGTASRALEERLKKGVELYQAGKAPTLLLTGDDGALRTNEVAVMREEALKANIPEAQLRVDPHGYRTYESCKRAKAAGYERLIVVTQRFHLARALFLCKTLGVDVQGVTASSDGVPRLWFHWGRDLLASVKAWNDLFIAPPKPPVLPNSSL